MSVSKAPSNRRRRAAIGVLGGDGGCGSSAGSFASGMRVGVLLLLLTAVVTALIGAGDGGVMDVEGGLVAVVCLSAAWLASLRPDLSLTGDGMMWLWDSLPGWLSQRLWCWCS